MILREWLSFWRRERSWERGSYSRRERAREREIQFMRDRERYWKREKLHKRERELLKGKELVWDRGIKRERERELVRERYSICEREWATEFLWQFCPSQKSKSIVVYKQAHGNVVPCVHINLWKHSDVCRYRPLTPLWVQIYDVTQHQHVP